MKFAKRYPILGMITVKKTVQQTNTWVNKDSVKIHLVVRLYHDVKDTLEIQKLLHYNPSTGITPTLFEDKIGVIRCNITGLCGYLRCNTTSQKTIVINSIYFMLS
jgi:hypothetical protein